MKGLKILNARETKELFGLIKKQWDCKPELDYTFIKNTKNRIFAVNREISSINLDKIRINSLGLYFAEVLEDEIRLSIEGSQLIGPNAAKNVIELDENEVKKLFSGKDVEKDTACSGFTILKHNKDFLGTGKVKDGRVLNFISKTRRINAN